MNRTISHSTHLAAPSVTSLSPPAHFAVVGTYAPRICGIATFTEDLVRALRLGSHGASVDVVVLKSPSEAISYPAEVVIEIRQEYWPDYIAAADTLNQRNVKAVSLQHEFGIFGGADGELIITFMERVVAPIVTTLHTVLHDATEHQREVLCRIAALSSSVVVMSQTARRFLIDLYAIPPDKIEVIPHGVPHRPFANTPDAKKQIGLAGRKTILTFGLLSGNKGVESMIQALPAIVRDHPTAIYIVLGAGHPLAVNKSGESYVDGLKRMVAEAGLEPNTRFETRFVELEELCLYLSATDVYVTPYINEDQITSGTLSYALGCGVATVSTPYWHAKELLAEGRGRLVPFRDSAALSRQVGDLLGNDVERHLIRRRAYTFSSGASWPNVGKRYLALFETVSSVPDSQSRK